MNFNFNCRGSSGIYIDYNKSDYALSEYNSGNRNRGLSYMSHSIHINSECPITDYIDQDEQDLKVTDLPMLTGNDWLYIEPLSVYKEHLSNYMISLSDRFSDKISRYNGICNMRQRSNAISTLSKVDMYNNAMKRRS